MQYTIFRKTYATFEFLVVGVCGARLRSVQRVFEAAVEAELTEILASC